MQEEVRPDKFYFEEPQRFQSLQLLKHLIPYSHLLLLTGLAGTGKTALINKLCEKQPDLWQVILFNAHSETQLAEIQQQISHSLGLSDQLDVEQLSSPDGIVAAKKVLMEWRQQGKGLVIIIDGAEALSAASLDQLLQFIECFNTDEFFMSFLLSVQVDKDDRDTRGHVAKIADQAMHVLKVQPFSQKQTGRYVAYRTECLYDGEGHIDVNPALVKKIYKKTTGVPAQINQVFDQMVASHGWGVFVELEEKASSSGVSMGIKMMFAVVIAGVLTWGAAAYFLFGQDDFLAEDKSLEPFLEKAGVDTMPQQVSPNVQSLSESQLAPDVVTEQADLDVHEGAAEPQQQAVADEALIEQSDTVDISAPVDEEPAMGAEETGTENLQMAHETDEAAVVKAQLKPISSNDEEISSLLTSAPVADDQLEKTKIQSSATVKAVVQKAQEKRVVQQAQASIRREDWLLMQQADHYGLQVMAVSNEETLKEFIQQHALIEQVAYLTTQRNGKPWYSLIYGVYPSRAAASRAASHLPRIITQQTQPWIRSMKSIQADIRR